jgi:hypothetical protein
MMRIGRLGKVCDAADCINIRSGSSAANANPFVRRFLSFPVRRLPSAPTALIFMRAIS